MRFSSLFAKKNAILGVDIGTANIKIVQITHGQEPILDTYGIVNSPFQIGEKNEEVGITQMAGILRTLLEKAGVSSKRCVISFPNSAVFTSLIQLPKMSEKELASAVEYEAKKYIPLALSEIDLSWVAVGGARTADEQIKILLTAVSKQVRKNYMRVFELAGLEPEAGEIEALALIRSLIGNVPSNCVIIDIGARSTGLNLIQNGFLKLSRNLNIGGDTITDKIAEALNISTSRAEQFKKDFGISNSTFIPETVKPVLELIKNETKQLLTIYHSQNSPVEKIFLVGGGANMPGLAAFFEDLKVKVEFGNPLKAVGYSKGLETVLKRYLLSLPVAIGLALRNEQY